MTAIEALTTPQKAKLTVEDFLVLDRSGAFSAYAKSELIDGTIYVVNAQHRPDGRIKSRLALRLVEALAGLPALEVLTEAAIDAGPGSLPEADILVTDEADGEGFVPLAFVHLVVEVADTSLAFDLGEKAALYAGFGIPEYWVVDVRARVVHQFWSPQEGAYRERRQLPNWEPIAAATLGGVRVATTGI